MEEKMEIVFVILNYNIVIETVMCAKSIIKSIDTNKIKIIIVDNGSKEGISSNVKELLKNYDNILYLDLETNIGFANGNNAGIELAKTFKPKFICCLNNDTEFIQYDFYRNLCLVYEQTKAAIIGPKVYLNNGSVQDFNRSLLSVKEYERQLKEYEKALDQNLKNKILRMFKNNKYIYGIYQRVLQNKKKSNNYNLNVQHTNVIIHGCCIIFSEKFIEKLDGFDNRTFLYREEELLYILSKKNGMSTVYDHRLFIKHLEDASTNTVFKKQSDRDKWYYSCQVTSTKILISELHCLSLKDEEL